MSSVVAFRPCETQHIQGVAFCMQCSHSWQAISPVGVGWAARETSE